ncbi:MAG: hypothetical protein ACRD4X_15195 [Candidatus Acidiferrales bacterium]
MRYFIVLVLLAVAFGGGFWWAHEKTEAVQNKLDAANAQLTQANATDRVYGLQNQLLTLVDDTANKNYGDAATVSTKFFNDLNGDISQENEAGVKSAMQAILAQRDQVTGELAKGDPASHDMFVQMLAELHRAVGSAATQSAGAA